MKLTKAFFEDIKDLIHSARATVARGVDFVQVYTNFEIGRRIVDQEQKGKGRAEYGQEVIKALADRLTEEFGMGFSARNLASMKALYLQYQDRRQILQTPSAKLIPGTKSQMISSRSQISQTLTAKLDPESIASCAAMCSSTSSSAASPTKISAKC